MAEPVAITCRCGKERLVKGDDAAYLRLATKSMCRSCEMDFLIAEDGCPESIPLPSNGFVMCALAWKHTGKCEPCITEDEMFHPAFEARITRDRSGEREVRADGAGG